MTMVLSPPRTSSDDDRRPALLALLVAAAGGAVTQALFWRTGVGLNFWIWDLAMIAGCVAVFRNGAIRPTAWGAMSASAVIGFSVVRFASEWSLAIALPSVLLILASLPVLLRDGLTLNELARLPWKLLLSFRSAPSAAASPARLVVRAVGRDTTVMKRLVLGLALGVPAAAFFALLLSSDDGFSHLVFRAKGKLGEGALFTLASVITALGYLFVHSLHTSKREGVSAGPADVRPYRVVGDLAAPAPATAPALSPLTWGIVLGQVALVFAVFAAANFRHLFGGDAIVRAPGPVTYASYLHAGFAQLLFATMLSVCLVVAGHALVRSAGGRLLAAVEGALLLLTGLALVSCWQRLRIYEDAYGASHLRLGVAMIELGVLGVLLLTMARVVFCRWSGHAGAVLAFGALMTVIATGINADAYVARTNLDRAERGKTLDAGYLASMSVDAREVLQHPVVKKDPALAARLEARFCEAPSGGWRESRGIVTACTP